MNVWKWLFRLFLGRRLPITSGRLRLPGVRAPIRIRRDDHGIPYIEAECDEDAWYGLGFCHGQDRAFQLEWWLRVARGSLAALVGAVALPVDRLARRVGFWHAAEQQLAALDDETRGMLEAYARGVTEGMRRGGRRLAHEFTLLGAQPTPYHPADALGILKVMAFLLASNWDCELARLRILTEDGPEALLALDPVYPSWLPVTSPPGVPADEATREALARLTEDLERFLATVQGGGGSNNWVIAPARTATGRPILANDPHLAPMLPSYWYLAHVRTPEWAVAGASFVGAPVFPAGHNGTLAWGVTAALADNTDLFLEEIGPDGRSVRQGETFIPCPIRREVISIRGGEAMEEEVLITPRGPVISPALEGESRAISLQAVWLEPRPMSGLPRLPRARTVEEFRHAFEEWPAIPFNFVFAHTAGTVGWQLVGEIPRRRRGWGTIPMPGWDPENGWEREPVPFAAMPYLIDPTAGFIATANNQPISHDEGPYLGIDWLDGYRVAAIVEALSRRTDWDLPSTQALQMDQRSRPWREIRPILLTIPAADEELRQALDLLRAWDGVLSADSAAATVFEFFLAEMSRRIAQAKAPRAASWALGRGFGLVISRTLFAVRRIGHLVRLIQEQPEGWFSRPWPEELADALREAVRALRRRYGDNPARWAWGRVRPLRLRHPLGERAFLRWVFNIEPIPWGGDAHTISQAAVDPTDPTANPLSIASLRMVLDVGNWDEARFALPGGQSGNPLSPHYDDLFPLWMRGQGVPIAWSPERIAQATRAELWLMADREGPEGGVGGEPSR